MALSAQGRYGLARITMAFFLANLVVLPCAGQGILLTALERIEKWQRMIDSLDGKGDGQVTLEIPEQGLAAGKLYFDQVNQITRAAQLSGITLLDQKQWLNEFGNWLGRIDSRNYRQLAAHRPRLEMIGKCLSEHNPERLQQLLMSNPAVSLDIIPFYLHRTVAKEVLSELAQKEPSLLLKQFQSFANRNYAADVLEVVAQHAPLTLAFYMGSDNLVSRTVHAASNRPNIANLLKIHRQVGSSSRIYLLMDDLIRHGWSVQKAEQITRNRDTLFLYLLGLQGRNGMLGSYSAKDELRYLSVLRVRILNEGHELPPAQRFKSVSGPEMDARALYFLMVYGESEMYTSTFLGLFDRFRQRLDNNTVLQFLSSVNFAGYASFLRMCAGYNTLGSLLENAPAWEIDLLFTRLSREIRLSTDRLEKAVNIIDMYGELPNDSLRGLMRKKIQDETRFTYGDPGLATLFGQLRQLSGLDTVQGHLDSLLVHFSGLPSSLLFREGIHVQQHFFYDDDDGRGSFHSFIQAFSSKTWRIKEFTNYVIIESTAGKKIRIYANRPDKEITGQKEIAGIFEQSGHYPELVVHRGHSYYVDATIEYLTPAAQLVVLGSCGGYKRVSQVLDQAPEAQLISTKQVGMRLINNAVLLEMAERIRRGEDISWDAFWVELEARFSGNKALQDNFREYVKPGDNHSVLLIRAYRESLMQ